MLVVFISLLCVMGLWYWMRRRRSTTDPPVMPESWPLLGHIHLLAKSPTSLVNVIEKVSLETIKLGGVATMYVGPIDLHVIADPEDAETAANTCLDKHYLYKFGKRWLGNGLVVSDISKWRRSRKLLVPPFGQQITNTFMGEFNVQAKRLVDQLANEVGKGPVRIDRYIFTNVLEAFYSTALGINPEKDPQQFTEYMSALHRLFGIFYQRMRNIFYHVDAIYYLSPLRKLEDKLINVLRGATNKVLVKRRSEMLQNAKNGDLPKDQPKQKYQPFLDHILALSDEKGLFTDTEVREQTDNIILAGHDTSANTMLFLSVLLGSYPDVQEKVYREIQEVLGNSEREIDKDDLSKLVYMDAVIKESMRLYSIAPVVARDVNTDLKLKNYTLRAGSSYLIMFWGLHHHPMWGPDVNEFKPERWLDPSRLPECPSAFAGFSIGKRGCIGRIYAMQSMKTYLAYIVRQYRIKADLSKMKLKFDIMLKPAGGHEVSLEYRN